MGGVGGRRVSGAAAILTLDDRVLAPASTPSEQPSCGADASRPAPLPPKTAGTRSAPEPPNLYERRAMTAREGAGRNQVDQLVLEPSFEPWGDRAFELPVGAPEWSDAGPRAGD